MALKKQLDDMAFIGVGVDTHTRKLYIPRGRESRSKGDPIFLVVVGWWLVGWRSGREEWRDATKKYFPEMKRRIFCLFWRVSSQIFVKSSNGLF